MLKNSKEKRKPPLALNISKRRKSLGFTQDELAVRVGVHINTIKLIETGMSEGQPDTRQAIATALGCSVAELFGSVPKQDSRPTLSDASAILLSYEKATPDTQLAVRHLLGLDSGDFARDVLDQAEAYLQQEASAKLKTSKR